MMIYVKMVRELVDCGMREEKAVQLVANSYAVDSKALLILIQLEDHN